MEEIKKYKAEDGTEFTNINDCISHDISEVMKKDFDSASRVKELDRIMRNYYDIAGFSVIPKGIKTKTPLEENPWTGPYIREPSIRYEVTGKENIKRLNDVIEKGVPLPKSMIEAAGVSTMPKDIGPTSGTPIEVEEVK